MARGINKVILVGNLGNDPVLRKTGSGDSVANVSMYTDEFYTDRNGQQQKRTVRHRLTLWGAQAENLVKSCKKGQPIFVQGRIGYNEWVDRENVKHSDAEITVQYIRWFPRSAGTARPVDAAKELRKDTSGDLMPPIDGATVALSEAEQRELDAEAAAFAAAASLDELHGQA